jgi:hypothetical protein
MTILDDIPADQALAQTPGINFTLAGQSQNLEIASFHVYNLDALSLKELNLLRLHSELLIPVTELSEVVQAPGVQVSGARYSKTVILTYFDLTEEFWAGLLVGIGREDA